MDRLGKYAALRPERIEQFSVEFKKDLLEGASSRKKFDKQKKARRERDRRRRKAESDSDSSASSSSSS